MALSPPSLLSRVRDVFPEGLGLADSVRELGSGAPQVRVESSTEEFVLPGLAVSSPLVRSHDPAGPASSVAAASQVVVACSVSPVCPDFTGSACATGSGAPQVRVELSSEVLALPGSAVSPPVVWSHDPAGPTIATACSAVASQAVDASDVEAVHASG